MGKIAKIIDEKGIVYDVETGEILAKEGDMSVVRGKNFRVVKNKSLDYLGNMITDNRMFTKLYCDELLYYIDKYNIKLEELRVFMYLCKHIKGESNLVADSGGRHLTNKDIIEEVKKNKSLVSRYISKLKQSNMIAGVSGDYYVNPEIISRGKRVYKSTIDMFKGGKR